MRVDWGNRYVKMTLWVMGLILLALIILFAIKQFSRLSSTESNPIAAIPDGSVVAFRISDPAAVWIEKVKNTVFWGMLREDKVFRQTTRILDVLDSLLHENGIELNPKAGEAFWLSIHRDEQDGFSALFIASPIGSGGLAHLPKLLAGYSSKTDDRGVKLIPGKDGIPDFYFSLERSLFIGSFDLQLLKKSLEHLSSGHRSEHDMPIESLTKYAGKNVDANMFISYKELSGFISGKMGSQWQDLTEIISGFASNVELDIDIRERDIVGVGFTQADDSLSIELGSFKGKGQIFIDRIVPANAKAFILYTPDAFSEWYPRWRPNSRFKVNEDPLLSWMGEELAMAWLEGQSLEDNPVAFLRATNIEDCQGKLMQWFLDVKDSEHDSLNYRGYFIGHLNTSDPLGPRFGNAWKLTSQSWFTWVDDYAVFASSPELLQSIINGYLAGFTLCNSEEYVDFASNVNKTSNLYIYADVRRLRLVDNKMFNPQFIIGNKTLVGSLEQGILAMQWVWDDGKYFTNLCYRTVKGEFPKAVSSGWQVKLKHNILKGPYVVNTHRDSRKRIVVVDETKAMHLLDPDGNVLWTHELKEMPFDGVQMVDLFKNGKIQYLLSSKNYIYLIDVNGRDVSGFPKKFKVAAESGMAVFDYESTKDYRLVYPGTDKKIHNLGVDGKPIMGWTPFKTHDLVIERISHLKMNDNDVIVFKDKSSEPYFLDRRGNVRIVPKSKVSAASSFFVDRSLPRHSLVFLDKAGNKISLSQGGDVLVSPMGNSQDNAGFTLVDFEADGQMEIVTLSSSMARIFSNDGKTLKDFNLPSSMNLASEKSFRVNQTRYILLHSPSDGSIALLGISGLDPRYSSFKGTLVPVMILGSDGSPQLLLSGENDMLIAYPLN